MLRDVPHPTYATRRPHDARRNNQEITIAMPWQIDRSDPAVRIECPGTYDRSVQAITLVRV